MKKLLSTAVILLSLISLMTCAVNEYTGSITVQNRSNKDALDLRVGDIYIGYVAKGGTATVYFYTEKSKSQISAAGFKAYNNLDGTNNLKPNYFYNLKLYNSGSEYLFNCTGSLCINFDAANPTIDDTIFLD